MVLSETKICNMALSEAGLGRIGKIGEGKLGRDCKSIYESVRNEVLVAYPWRCAKARAILSRQVDAPIGYSYAYNLPSDCLKPMSLVNTKIVYVVEDGKILTNSDEEIQLLYIKEVTDAALFDTSLANAVAARMAAPLAIMVKQSRVLSAQMWELYSARISDMEATNEADNNDAHDPDMPDSYYAAR